MICKTYASKILNTLMGVGSNTLTAPVNVYLGLCAREPDAADGGLTNAGEPTSVGSYERKAVGGTSSSIQYFGASSGGVIKNNVEIQLKTAREDYPEKINFWFLSTNKNGGGAYLWGKIKDVLSDTKTVSGFMVDSATDAYVASTTSDTLLGLKEGETYIVSWDGKDYEEVAALYENDGKSYIRLGNPLVSGGENDEEKPFGILYNETTTGIETVGNMQIYSLTGEATHDVAIYSIGIEVKKATVPTFYENELQASIDV